VNLQEFIFGSQMTGTPLELLHPQLSPLPTYIPPYKWNISTTRQYYNATKKISGQKSLENQESLDLISFFMYSLLARLLVPAISYQAHKIFLILFKVSAGTPKF